MRIITLLILSIILGISYSVPSHADNYDLIKGQDNEICETFLKYLNSFKPKRPMVCGLLENQNIKDFNLPSWKRLNVSKNMMIFEQTFKLSRQKSYSSEKELSGEWNDYVNTIPSLINGNKVSLDFSNFDIDNDGNIEKVLKFNENNCDEKTHSDFVFSPGEILQVIDDKNTKVLPGYKKLLRFISYPFIYKDKTYFSNWEGGYKDNKELIGKLHVYKSFKPLNKFGLGLVCEFNFVK